MRMAKKSKSGENSKQDEKKAKRKKKPPPKLPRRAIETAIAQKRFPTFTIYKLLNEGSSFFEFTREIHAKKACINVKNNDNNCFFWAVTSALYPAKKNSDRISSYPDFKTVLKVENIKVPVSFDDVKIFEVINNISINIFEFNPENKIIPSYLMI